MKVLYLVSGIGPPAGWGTEFIQNLIFELSKKRIKATIINPIYHHTHSDWKQWAKEQNKKYGVRIISFEVPKFIQKRFLLHLLATPFFTTFYIFKLLIKEKFDLIHEFSSTPIILFRAKLLRFFFRTPTVFTLSVYNNTLLGNFCWFKIFNFAKYYLIPSREIIKKLISMGISKNKIIFSPPGIPLNNFINKIDKITARKNLHLPTNKFIFSYFGSLTTEKGVNEILKASQLIPSHLHNKILICLFAIWKGSTEHRDIKRAIKELNLHYLDFREKYIHIPTLLAASNAVIFPQRTGLGVTIPPISIIESLAADKKVILSDIPINAEFKKSKQCLFMPAGDSKQLAKIMEAILINRSTSKPDKNLWRLNRFNLVKSIGLHLSVYKQIVEQE